VTVFATNFLVNEHNSFWGVRKISKSDYPIFVAVCPTIRPNGTTRLN